MARHIGVGVIGIGVFGKLHARVCAESPLMRLVAACSRREVSVQWSLVDSDFTVIGQNIAEQQF